VTYFISLQLSGSAVEKAAVRVTGTVQSLIFSFIMIFSVILIIGCAGTADQFSEGLRFMSGKGGTKEKRNTIEEITPIAKELSSHQPKPLWQTVVHADETDIVELISENRLLIGMLQLSSALAEPGFGNIALYDTVDGHMLWQTPRRALVGGNYGLLAAQPVILLQGQSPEVSCYSGIDPSSGVVKWEHTVKHSHRIALDLNNNLLIILSKNSNNYRLNALNIENGTTAWSHDLNKVNKDDLGIHSISVHNNNVYITAGGLYKISLTSGALLWSVPLADSGNLSFVAFPGGVLVWEDKSMHLYDSQTGEHLWGPLTLPAKIIKVSIHPEHKYRSFVITRKKEFIKATNSYFNSDKIHAIDLRKGVTVWNYFAGSVYSNLLFESGKIYLLKSLDMCALDASSGKLLMEIDTPIFGDPEHLPVILLSRPDAIVLISEIHGIAAFSKDTGQVLWHQKTDLMKSSIFWFVTRKKVLAQYESVAKSADEALERDASWWQSWTDTVEYQWSGYNPDPAKRYMTTDSFGHSMILFQHALAFSSYIEGALKKASLRGLVERLRLWVSNSLKVHARSVQGNYYIRPYTYRGEGILIVDLNTGKRADFIYSAPNKGMEHYTFRQPLFAIDSVNNRILTTGISLDYTSYEKYVKGGLGMPYPSVLSYPISSIEFHD